MPLITINKDFDSSINKSSSSHKVSWTVQRSLLPKGPLVLVLKQATLIITNTGVKKRTSIGEVDEGIDGHGFFFGSLRIDNYDLHEPTANSRSYIASAHSSLTPPSPDSEFNGEIDLQLDGLKRRNIVNPNMYMGVIDDMRGSIDFTLIMKQSNLWKSSLTSFPVHGPLFPDEHFYFFHSKHTLVSGYDTYPNGLGVYETAQGNITRNDSYPLRCSLLFEYYSPQEKV